MRALVAVLLLGCACESTPPGTRTAPPAPIEAVAPAPVARPVEPAEEALGFVDEGEPEEPVFGDLDPVRAAIAELLPWLDAHPGARIGTASAHLARVELVTTSTSVACVHLEDGVWHGVPGYALPAAPGDYCVELTRAASAVALLARDARDDDDEATPIPYSLFVRLDDQTFRLGPSGLQPASVRTASSEHWSGASPTVTGGPRIELTPVERTADVPWSAIETLEVRRAGECLEGNRFFACPTSGRWSAIDPAWAERLGAIREVSFRDGVVVVESQHCASGSDVSDCADLLHVLRVVGDRLRIEGSIVLAENWSSHYRDWNWGEPDEGLSLAGASRTVRWRHRVLGPRCVAFDDVEVVRSRYESFLPEGRGSPRVSAHDIASRAVLVAGPSSLPRVPFYVAPEHLVGEETPLAEDRDSLEEDDEPIPEEVEVFDRRGTWELRGETWERVEACS